MITQIRYSKITDKMRHVFLVADPRLHLAVMVGMSVHRSVHHIFEFQAVFVLLLLPNRLRLDCHVSDLVG